MIALFVEFAQIERVSTVFADKLDDVVVGMARNGAGNGMVRLEDHARRPWPR